MTSRLSQISATEPSSHDIVIATATEAGVSNAEICAFYAKYWTRPIALTREDFVRWQFSTAPGADGQNHSVVAVSDGALIAVLGATPRSFETGNGIMNAAELTTWIVAPEAQGRGVGARILGFLQERYDVLTGAGITEQALPVYLKAEFTFLAHIPRFFFVSGFSKLSTFASPHPAALATVERRQNMAESIDFHAKQCSAAALGEVHVSASATVAQSQRSSAYLQWRYDSHPVFTYESFLVSEGGSDAPHVGVVIRQDDVGGVPFLHLVDVVGEPAGYTAAVAFLEAEAVKRGCAFVDASATCRHLNLAFRARGWNSAVDDPLIALPSLFYPVEFRKPPTTSVIFWSRSDKSSLYDFSGLHITKGDLDLDRPTLDFYQKHGR